MPSGREDIGEHHIVVFLLRSILRQLQAVEIGVRHAEVFRLAALQLSHAGVAVAGTGGAWIQSQASRGQAALAILAEAARRIERDADVVADLETRDRGAAFGDLPQVLVADDLALFEIRSPFIHVKVGPADVRGGDSHNDVVRVLDGRVGHLFDFDVTGAVVDDGFHGQSSAVELARYVIVRARESCRAGDVSSRRRATSSCGACGQPGRRASMKILRMEGWRARISSSMDVTAAT